MPHGTAISSYDIFLFSFRIRPPSRSIELIDGIDICDIRCSRLTAMTRERFEKFGRYRTPRRGRRLLSNAIKFRGQGFSRGEERDGNIFTRASLCSLLLPRAIVRARKLAAWMQRSSWWRDRSDDRVTFDVGVSRSMWLSRRDNNETAFPCSLKTPVIEPFRRSTRVHLRESRVKRSESQRGLRTVSEFRSTRN